MLADLGEVFEGFVVAAIDGGDLVEVRTEPLDCPDDGLCFQYENGLVQLVVATDKHCRSA